MEQFSTKKIILDKALFLFSQKGYDGVGVQQIVEDCNITKPTLYYYFKSKAGLLEEIINTYGNDLYNRINKSTEYNYDFIKNLSDCLYTVIDFAKNNVNYFIFHNSLMFFPKDNEVYKIHSQLQNKIDNAFKILFEKGVNQLGNMKGYEHLFAKNFETLVFATALSVLNGESVNDDTIYRIVRAFVYGVAN